MKFVTSTQNPAVRALRELGQAKARAQRGLFLAEGVKLCAEALRDAQVETVLCDEARAGEFSTLLAACGDVLLAPAHIVASACQTQTPQGIVASVRMPAPLALAEPPAALLALDGVQDPGNVGTMLRTAEAAGFGGALLSESCADAFAPKTVRATMGSIYRLPIRRGSLAAALETLREKGYAVIVGELGGEPFYPAVRALDGPLVLVVGSEGRGVCDAVRALATLRVALPMRGRAESLNAAVAAGIMMYGLMERPARPGADAAARG